MRYLLELTPEEWERSPYALGQFLQGTQITDDPEWLGRFATLFNGIIDHHGKDVLIRYLESTSWPNRSAAVQVLDAMERSLAMWAVERIDAVASDESIPLFARNHAAQVAARIAGRPAPDPIVQAPLPTSTDVLADKLAGLDLNDFDARAAVKELAAELGDDARPALTAWLEAELGDPGYSAGSFVASIPQLVDALADVLRAGDDRATTYRLARQARLPAELFEDLLRTAPVDVRGVVAETLADVTGEKAVQDVLSDREDVRKYAVTRVAKLSPQQAARQGVGILDAALFWVRGWGWQPDVYTLLETLDRADVGELVTTLTTHLSGGAHSDDYWRAKPYYKQEIIVEFLRELQGMQRVGPWASKALAACDA